MSAEAVRAVPIALSVHPSRMRPSDRPGTVATFGRIAVALRFPAVLLTAILLFLAFQQRADRGDPKLAHAPVGTRQETLGFR